jgi:type I restriction enzyme S subunit
MKWEKVEIGQLGEVITGSTPPRKNPELYGDFIPFIKPTDMEIDRRYTPDPEECYSELGFEKYRKSLIPEGSTCVVTIGSIGKKMTQAYTDCFINQAVNAVIPNKDYDNDFVFYLLKNNLDKVKGLDSGTSSGRENVSKSAFSSIQVRVIKNLDTQRKIASILSAYDDLIENNLKRIKLLEEKAFLSYKGTIVDSSNLAGSRKKLKDVLDLKYGKALKAEHRVEGKFPVFGSSGNVGFHDKFLVNGPGIVVGRKGNVGSVFWSFENFWPIDTSYYVQSDVSLYFLYFNLKEQHFVDTDAAVPGLNRNFALDNPILLPAPERIIEFEEKVKPLFALMQNLYQQNAKLREARDILLPRLMSGEIVV